MTIALDFLKRQVDEANIVIEHLETGNPGAASSLYDSLDPDKPSKEDFYHEMESLDDMVEKLHVFSMEHEKRGIFSWNWGVIRNELNESRNTRAKMIAKHVRYIAQDTINRETGRFEKEVADASSML